jgi:hypothetical protein
MTPKLAQAIEDLYQAFSDVPRPRTLTFCECCLNREQISILFSKPLRELSPDDLTDYAASVFNTGGAIADFLYFLPRILEIRITEDFWWPDPEVIGEAIHSSGFHQSWKDPHRRALLHFFDELVNSWASDEDESTNIDHWICAFAILHLDLAPFLDRLAKDGPSLIEFYERNSRRLAKAGRLSSGFWEKAPDEEMQVVAWFTSPEIRKAIKDAYGLE